MYTFSIKGKTTSIFPSFEANAPIIYLNTFSNEGQKVYEAMRAANCPPFTLVAISNPDWNHGMVPWDSPPAFKNAEPLHRRCGRLSAAPYRGDHPISKEGNCRNSLLAGDRRIFSGWVVCAVRHLPDGPVFPGGQHVRFPLVTWDEGHIFSHEPKRWPDCIYFSLGNKESKTQNPVLRSGQQNTEEICAFYKKGIETVFQLNPGNLYTHVVDRTITGIAWMLRQEDLSKNLFLGTMAI